MAFTKGVWDQLRTTTADQFIAALERDGFTPDPACKGAVLVYIRFESPKNRTVVLHYHPGKTWSPKFLKGLLDDIGWKEAGLYRVGLVAGEYKPQEEHAATHLVPCGCDGGVTADGQPCPDCGGLRFREVRA